jgi:pimeloyl-ACP methyl ester carboxylesterase
VKLYCERFPGLSKQNTVFIHGNLASTKWWGPTLTEWKKAGSMGSADLICADWRGCGQNADWSQDSAFSIEDLAADFLQLIETENLGQVNLVGHSLGGLIALQMMVMQPKIVNKTVLLDSVGAKGVVFDDSMYEAFRQMAASRDLTKMVILSTIANSDQLPAAFTESLADDAFKAVKGIGTSVLEILKTVNMEEALKAVNTPTLVLHGTKDAVIPLKDSEHLASLLPNAKLQTLADVGHCWNVENPAAFTQTLRQWL